MDIERAGMKTFNFCCVQVHNLSYLPRRNNILFERHVHPFGSTTQAFISDNQSDRLIMVVYSTLCCVVVWLCGCVVVQVVHGYSLSTQHTFSDHCSQPTSIANPSTLPSNTPLKPIQDTRRPLKNQSGIWQFKFQLQIRFPLIYLIYLAISQFCFFLTQLIMFKY